MHTLDISKTQVSGQREASFLGWFLTAYQSMRKRSQAREAVERLLHHDDRILDDIGVTRADVLDALAAGTKVDATEALAARRRERQMARQAGKAL